MSTQTLRTPETTVILSGRGILEQPSTVHVTVEATIEVTAKTAQRQVTIWLASEVGNMLIGGTPQLLIARQVVWRVPVLLTSSKVGIVGEVGVVEVDAISGSLLNLASAQAQIRGSVAHVTSTT